MKKVFIVWWSNGAFFRECEERHIETSSLSKETAQSYVDKWKEKYKRECDEFAAKNNFTEEDCEAEFTEEMWIEEYELI